MGCITESLSRDVESAFSAHETRELEDGIYRVSKTWPSDQALVSGETVHATLAYDRWHCQVPQCGATFPDTFAIDIHLEAHGANSSSAVGCPRRRPISRSANR